MFLVFVDQGSEREITNVTLDVRDKNEFDPEEHHVIFSTERLIREETYSKGAQKIGIEGDGRYSGLLAEDVDNWDVIFRHATETSSPSSSTPSINGSGSGLQGDRGSVNGDTSGTISESRRIHVQVSEKFKQQVYERFNHRCPLFSIEQSEMLTISRILSRTDNHDLAENIENAPNGAIQPIPATLVDVLSRHQCDHQ